MAFQLSPGVLVTEKDLTNIVPAVATSTGAYAGVFMWGPVMDTTTISSENQLVSRFGRPVDGNAASWFTAANFLAYTNNLLLVRVDTTAARNAVSTLSGTVTNVEIVAGGSGYLNPVVEFSAPQITGGVTATGTAVVEDGVIVSINITDPGSGYTSAPTITVTDSVGVDFDGTPEIVVGGIKIRNEVEYETNYANGAGVVGTWAAKYPGSLGNSIRVEMADSATFSSWTYRTEFDSAPGTSTYVDGVNGLNDEMHIILIDDNGAWTGTRGAILEKFEFVSKAVDARKPDGTNNYYRNVINVNSKYIWWMDHPTAVGVGAAWGSQARNSTFASLSSLSVSNLDGGVDDLSPTAGQLQEGFSIFANSEIYDISLIPTGPVTAPVAKFVVEQIAEVRKDCVAFVSPVTSSGNVIQGLDIVEETIGFRQQSSFNVNSSYGVLDSGWKYQYDRYNDKYRWVPLNGDIAGLCARTDLTNDPWWSPGGLNRGQIKNVVRLNVTPNKTERDELYKAGINPVVTFPGQGTVLFGDKTLLAKPSAFDRINVRRLFIVLEKAIATAAKYQLFEFNDFFTRAQFKNLVEPFLRDVQGRRGVIDFRVICDETNNTGEVIDRNEFVADIYIKPARSINFITLNFVAVRTGISFDEIGG